MSGNGGSTGRAAGGARSRRAAAGGYGLLALVLACEFAALGCARSRPPPEASLAASVPERMRELEERIVRDRSILSTHVSANVADDQRPSDDLLRAIAWRLPGYQQELAERRGSDWQPEPPPPLPPALPFPRVDWPADDEPQ